MCCDSKGDCGESERSLKDYIDRLKEKIVLKVVLLFGSKARGKAGRRSDYDLLIVSDDLPRDYHKRLELLFADKPGNIDSLGFREDEIDDVIHRHFLLKAIMEGKVLLGDGAFLKKKAGEYIRENGLVPTPFGYTHYE